MQTYRKDTSYQSGDAPTSAQQLIPFMVLIAARTGMNAYSLYGLERDCLTPHELDEGLFYCVWDKPRAGKQQRQIHRIDQHKQTGVVELIRFMRTYAEPLASRAGPRDALSSPEKRYSATETTLAIVVVADISPTIRFSPSTQRRIS